MISLKTNESLKHSMSDGTAATTQGQIFIFVAGTAIVAIAAGIVTWVRKKIGCQDKIDARTLRQSHAMIAMAKNQDEITKRLHPEDGVTNFADTVESLLKDEFGNL